MREQEQRVLTGDMRAASRSVGVQGRGSDPPGPITN